MISLKFRSENVQLLIPIFFHLLRDVVRYLKKLSKNWICSIRIGHVQTGYFRFLSVFGPPCLCVQSRWYDTDFELFEMMYFFLKSLLIGSQGQKTFHPKDGKL